MAEQEERRQNPDPRKIEYTLARIDVKLDSLETSLNTRLSDQDRVVQAQFSHIDTIINHLIKAQSDQYDRLLVEFKRMFDLHSEQNIADIAHHSNQIDGLDAKIESNTLSINELDKRVTALEAAPGAEALDQKKKFRADIKTALISFLIGGGAVAAIIAAIQLYLQSGGQ